MVVVFGVCVSVRVWVLYQCGRVTEGVFSQLGETTNDERND